MAWCFVNLRGETGDDVWVRVDQIAAFQPPKDRMGGVLVTTLSGARFLGSKDVDDLLEDIQRGVAEIENGA